MYIDRVTVENRSRNRGFSRLLTFTIIFLTHATGWLILCVPHQPFENDPNVITQKSWYIYSIHRMQQLIICQHFLLR